MPKQNVNICLSPHLAVVVKEKAQKLGMSVSAYITMLINQDIER